MGVIEVVYVMEEGGVWFWMEEGKDMVIGFNVWGLGGLYGVEDYMVVVGDS